jgi:hypothetical protein
VSLAIDVETIFEVLLPDGWHIVAKNSFTLDSFDFVQGGRSQPLHSGGVGFWFMEANKMALEQPKPLAGPVSSIIALRSRPVK